MTTEKAIQLLNSKINELSTVRTPDDFISWRNSAVQRLQIICPNNPIISQVQKIRATTTYTGDSIVHKVIPNVKLMLESLKEDIQTVGIETYHNNENHSENRNVVTVNNTNSQNQSQNQEQSISFEFVIDCLKKGLRDTELEELKDILESNDAPKIKKKKFSEKLLSFGSDVASNILANVLTNPQIYEKLGSML